MRMKYRLLLFFTLLILSTAKAQSPQPVKHFERSDFSKEDSIRLLKNFGKNKILIPQFSLPMLVALSYYPELRNTPIRFIYKPAVSTLTTKPNFPSLLLSGDKRT